MTYNEILLIAYSCVLVFMSLVTLFLFFRDKGLAKKNNGPKRIKEKTLLGAIALGGALGGILGMVFAHHKTDKGYFRFTAFVSLISQILALGLLIYFVVGGVF